MTCEHCTRARAGIWCGYLSTCSECIARTLARSLHAFNALHDRGTGDRDELRQAILRALPGIDYAEACRMVRGWWKADRAMASANSAATTDRARARFVAKEPVRRQFKA